MTASNNCFDSSASKIKHILQEKMQQLVVLTHFALLTPIGAIIIKNKTAWAAKDLVGGYNRVVLKIKHISSENRYNNTNATNNHLTGLLATLLAYRAQGALLGRVIRAR